MMTLLPLWFVRLKCLLVCQDTKVEISYRLDSGFAPVFSIADIFQQMGV
jgi:hypothetical protein